MAAGWVSQTPGHGPWINHDHPDWRITLVINGDIQFCRVTYKDHVLQDIATKDNAETFVENITKITQASGDVRTGETPRPSREAKLTRSTSDRCVPTERRKTMDAWVQKMKLAVDVLLGEADEISDGLETELYALRDKLHVMALEQARK